LNTKRESGCNLKSLSNPQILCSDVYPENGGGTLTSHCGPIPDEFGIFGVGVRAINLKEGWVYFILDGTYADPN
jgi:hypothetical protein